MLVTKSQIFVFIACVAFGVTAGVIFSVSDFIKHFIKHKILKEIPDIFGFIIFALAFIVYSYYMCFPTYRIYMTMGAILGLLLYYKSFHLTLAKCTEKLYNITVKILTHKKKNNIKREKNDVRRKVGKFTKTRKRVG